MVSVSSSVVGGSGSALPVLPTAPTTGTVSSNSVISTATSVSAGSGTGSNTDGTSSDTIAAQIAKAMQAGKLNNAAPASEDTMAELQSKMNKLNPELTFVLDKSSNRAVIQLMDRNTKEVIQQFPSAAALQISQALDRYANGKLVNKVA